MGLLTRLRDDIFAKRTLSMHRDGAIVVSRDNEKSPWPKAESPAPTYTVVRSPHRLHGVADPVHAGFLVWACAGEISRAKLLSASSASRKIKGASPVSLAAPQTLSPPSRRETLTGDPPSIG